MIEKKAYPIFLLQWLKFLYPLLFLSLPFSLEIPILGAMVSTPAELLMLLIAVVTGIMTWMHAFLWRSYARHPITIASVVYLLWMALTVPYSTMPLVSAKFFMITLLHWWVCFAGVIIFANVAKEDRTDAGRLEYLPYIRQGTDLLNAYLLSFLLIILYAWWVHGYFSFLPETSNLAARPFYFDHTAYSACMAMLFWVPWLIPQQRNDTDHKTGIGRFNTLLKGDFWRTSTRKVWVVRLILGMGIFLSFSRATWLGMAVATVFWVLRWIWEKNRILAGGMAVIIALSLLGVIRFSQGHDVSSLERYNRYSCAWRMFLDKPVTGFGAGTFPEQYLGYQRLEEMTRISVTQGGLHQPGRGGSTHSEYLQALAELGLIGALCWLSLALLVIVNVFRHPLRSPLTMIALGLMTFMVHACFNNFLHTDKIGVLVWILLAMLVRYDVKSMRFRNE